MILRSIEELQHKPGMVSKTPCPESTLVVFRVQKNGWCLHLITSVLISFFHGSLGRDGQEKKGF